MSSCKLTGWTLISVLFLVVHNLQAQTDAELSQNSQNTDDDEAVLSCDCPVEEATCSGTKIWADGTTYEGEFQYGIIHGKGKLRLNDGSSYEGDFEDETFHGYGTMTYEDGSQYIGDWVNGYREGMGALVYPDGTEYLGEFVYDEMHGEGSILLSNGESYSGSWEYGQIHGFGTLYRMDGSKYTGLNKGGKRDGAGYITYESGDTLYGNWNAGKIADEAIFNFEDGASMISYWEDGKMLDTAIYINPHGFRFSAPTDQLASVVLEKGLGEEDVTKDQFALAFYAIAMEYKSMQDVKGAEQHLQYAAQFGDPAKESPIRKMVETQLASLSSDKENAGMAKLEEEK